MIKSLLLATSCVIGSGAGALHKNAPVFNQTHYQVFGSNTTTQVKIYSEPDLIEANQIYRNPKRNRARQQESYTYKNDLSIQYTITCGSNWVENGYDPDKLIKTYKITKITPYKQFLNIRIENIINNTVDFNAGEDAEIRFHIETYFTKDTKVERILNQYNYADATYNPLSIFTAEERSHMNIAEATLEWFQLDVEDNESINAEITVENINDINGSWISLDGTTDVTQAIQSSLDSFYIIQEVIFDGQTDEATWSNPNGVIDVYSKYTLTYTNEQVTPNNVNYEVIDIGGLMFEILTMPFTFISRAFNLTLFPDTPYSVNISQLFLSLFAALVFIWIIKKFVKK